MKPMSYICIYVYMKCVVKWGKVGKKGENGGGRLHIVVECVRSGSAGYFVYLCVPYFFIHIRSHHFSSRVYPTIYLSLYRKYRSILYPISRMS